MKSRYIISQILLLTIVLFSCANFTGGANDTKDNRVQFVDLLEGEDNYAGKIYDEKNIIPVHKISFTGHTRIGGIYSLDDDSVNNLDLSKIKEIEILEEIYNPNQKPINRKKKIFIGQEFCLIKVTSNNNSVTNNLLVPKDVVICATSIETDMEKAWYLRKIKKVTIEKNLRMERKKIIEEKIKEKDQSLKNKKTFLGKNKKRFFKGN